MSVSCQEFVVLIYFLVVLWGQFFKREKKGVIGLSSQLAAILAAVRDTAPT